LWAPFAAPVAEAVDIQGVDQSADAEQVARFALSSPPQGFDPVRHSQIVDSVVQLQLFECLTEYDYLAQDSSVVGQLAESWTVSEDGLEWRFKLKPSASFHDPFDPPLWPGRTRKVTANDVLYCWLRQADARSPSEGYWAMDGILLGIEDYREATGSLDPTSAASAMAAALENGIPGIQVIDEHELLIRLQQPDANLPNRLAMNYFAVYPYEAVTKDGRSLRDQPVGSAPFVVDYWLPEQTLILKRTPEWRQEKSPFDDHALLPYLDKVEFHVVRQVETRNEMFISGAVDRVAVGNAARNKFFDEDLELHDRFKQQGVVLADYERGDITMLCFGMDDPVVGDIPGDEAGNAKRKLLRRALALAFPYRQWHEEIRKNFPATPALTFLPPVVPGADRLAPSNWNHTDIELAKSLLAEAGYPGGKGLPELEFLLTGTGPESLSTGELVVAGLKRIGVKCKAVPMAYHEQLARARNGDAQLFLRAWVLDWPDGALILQNFHGPQASTGVNLSRFVDPRFDKLFEQYRTLPEGDGRHALLKDMHELLEDMVPAVAIDHRRARLLTQPWLGNFLVHPFQSYSCKYYRIENH